MKKTVIACAIAAGLCLVAGGAQAFNGGGGGGHFSGGGFHGAAFHGGHFHGNHFHGGCCGFGGSVFIGAPWYWWGAPGYYYDYPAYSYYPYYDYQTQVYVDPSATGAPAAPQAQYYCPDAGYYPAVPSCPRGWLRVLPDGGPR